MEFFPATNEEQFEYIKKQIAGSDYYVLVIGGRYGSVDEDGIIYTEKEFDYAIQTEIPVLVFPIRDPDQVEVGRTDKDQQKAEKLGRFREKAMRKRLCHAWANADDLCLGILKALQQAIDAYPRPGWVRGDVIQTMEAQSTAHAQQASLKPKAQIANQAPRKQLRESDLSQELKFSYEHKAVRQECALKVSDILGEISLTEQVSFDLFEEAIRGAISAWTGEPYFDISVDRSEVDKLIFALAAADIIWIVPSNKSVTLIIGPNWVAANMKVKLSAPAEQ
jgi:Domain of unknown function (DUF4062)